MYIVLDLVEGEFCERSPDEGYLKLESSGFEDQKITIWFSPASRNKGSVSAHELLRAVTAITRY